MIRSVDLDNLGTAWYVSAIPTFDRSVQASLSIKQKCLLPFGQLAPLIHSVPLSVEGYYTAISIRIDLPSELELSLPDGTGSATVIIQYEHTPPINNYFNMSSQFSPPGTPPTDPALLATLATIAANTASTNASVNAVADAPKLTVNTLVTITPSLTMDAVSNKIHAADPKCRELIISNNSSSATFKVVSQNTTGAAFASITAFIGNPIPPGGSLVIDDPMCRGDFWAIGSGSGSITIAKAGIL